MSKISSKKILNVFFSLVISFLIIFIVSMLARSLATNVLPEDSKVSLFINDYVDMMIKKVDSISLRMKIKRNTVSQYQVDLINQSIDDYVSYSMFKSAKVASTYNPNSSPSSTDLDAYKSEYYKMTLENPYLRSMTLFSTNGKMLLNLYSSKSKSWPLELEQNLINNLKMKGSLVLNASNENSFYTMQYLRNKNGDLIVAAKNDYVYVSDIAMYYQVADKSLHVNDSRNLVYNIPDGMASKSIENVSSVIGRYAYYKSEPSFVNNDAGLSVTLIGREYPNYFELIVLGITAFFIVMLQYIIRGIIYIFARMIDFKTHSENDILSPTDSSTPMIDEDIIKAELPRSARYEELDMAEQKSVVHKVDEELFKFKKEEVIAGLGLNEVSGLSLDKELEDYGQPRNEDFYYSLKNYSLEEKNKDINSFVQKYEYAEKKEEEITPEHKESSDNVGAKLDYTYSDGVVKEVVHEEKENDEYNKKLESSVAFSLNGREESTSDKEPSKEDVFLAFDKMLESIVMKAESKARDSLSKKI